MLRHSPSESTKGLLERIAVLLSDTLGAEPYQPRRSTQSNMVGVRGVIGYTLLFCVLPGILFGYKGILFWLSVWGSCYFACATILARTTSSSILKMIEEEIVPGLSHRASVAIEDDLARRFGKSRVAVVSLIVALVASAVSAIALVNDINSPSLMEVCWLCCGFFILYLTAARATYIASFYGTFGTHLKIDSNLIYSLDPAHSIQVRHIAELGKRVLFFWFGIVCLVATLVPFFIKYLHLFVFFVVPTAGFFSGVFSTIVFLHSENSIRTVVDEIAASTLRSAEREISELFGRRNSLQDVDLRRLEALMRLHGKLVTNGFYRSALLSSFSLIVPLVGPAVTVIWPFIKRLLPDLKF